MRLLLQDTLVMGIDFQEKLVPVLHDRDRFIASAVKLFRGAEALRIPALLTVQYTKGLGPTVAEIAAVTVGVPCLEKRCFSALDNDPIKTWVAKSGKKTVVLCGAEAHICVLQTAIDLIAADYTVAVAADCIASRSPENRDYAVQRLRCEGALIVTLESILFELLRTSEHSAFGTISRLIKGNL